MSDGLLKALVIREPWIDLILEGRKTWELRSRSTSIRGRIALARKGSGLLVGTARLVDVLPLLDRKALEETVDRHGVAAHKLDDVEAAGWVVPWVLEDVRRLDPPVPYHHPSGAVTWVNLNPVTASIAAGEAEASPGGRAERLGVLRPSAPAAAEALIALTAGNIRHSHVYLRQALHLFPDDAIGGSNKGTLGRAVTVTFEIDGAVDTDIAGDKLIFRARGAVGHFLKASGARAGDHVLVRRLGPREYNLSIVRSAEAAPAA